MSGMALSFSIQADATAFSERNFLRLYTSCNGLRSVALSQKGETTRTVDSTRVVSFLFSAEDGGTYAYSL